MAFSYSLKKTEKYALLSMQGRLVDKSEAVEISIEIDELLNEGVHHFIIDLSDVEYMNSTGLNILINLMNKTQDQGGESIIAGATSRIKSLFAVTKLDSVFTLKQTTEEATVYFAEKA